MASNYRIKVQVEIEECADVVTDEPRQGDVGVFERVVTAQQAYSIDECEQVVLQTSSEAMRAAFAQHLSQVSRQYAEAEGSLDECEVKEYRVDGEIGRIMFDSYWVRQAAEGGDVTLSSLFPALHAKEWYRTTGFKELALVYGVTEESYRKTSALINRVRHQSGATPHRTLRENAEGEGRRIMAHMEQQALNILHEHAFTPEGTPTASAVGRSEQVLVRLPSPQVEQALQVCAPDPEWVADMADNAVPYEDLTQSVQVSLDDVNVKRQKAARTGDQDSTHSKYVHNTIAHIAHADTAYTLNGAGVVHVLRLVLAFLLHNHLLHYNLIFFVDGQRTLYTAILRAFTWFHPIQIILDWYHLEKRCKEQLSLALKGRVIRNALLDQLRPCLWHGCVDRAIAILQTVDSAQVKDQTALDTLIDYLERNRPYLPCYAVRKHLRLRNSSNLGEKANDLIVSDRQKHNGMSWSKPGSVALATVTALIRNREFGHWFQSGTLSFSFNAAG